MLIEALYDMPPVSMSRTRPVEETSYHADSDVYDEDDYYYDDLSDDSY